MDYEKTFNQRQMTKTKDQIKMEKAVLKKLNKKHKKYKKKYIGLIEDEIFEKG